MYKKLFVLVCVLLLAISMSVAAVNFSQSTKITYQQKITRIINKAATYVSISASEKAWYSNYFNNALNEIEKMYKEPNIPESAKISAGKSFFDEIDYMENYLNNTTISNAQKVQEIKATMKQISDAEAQDKQIEEQNRIAEERWRAEQEAARKKAQAEQAKRVAEQEAARKKAQLEQAKRVAEQEAAKKKVENERAKRLAEQEAARKKAQAVQEEKRNQAAIKKECYAVVSGLCFKHLSVTGQYGYKTPSGFDFWADSDKTCKKYNMALPSISQLKTLYNYGKSKNEIAIGTGVWTSEGKWFTSDGEVKDKNKWSYGFYDAVCVKSVNSVSPFNKIEEFLGVWY